MLLPKWQHVFLLNLNISFSINGAFTGALMPLMPSEGSMSNTFHFSLLELRRRKEGRVADFLLCGGRLTSS